MIASVTLNQLVVPRKVAGRTHHQFTIYFYGIVNGWFIQESSVMSILSQNIQSRLPTLHTRQTRRT